MSFGNGSKITELQKRIEHLKTTNGALCSEINRQERVIEQLREKEAAYMDANHEQEMQLFEQGVQLIEQGKRIYELESLVLDMYSVLNVHEKAYRDDFGFTASKHFESRMAELGLEVDA